MRHTLRAAIVVALLLLAFNSSATAAPILHVVGSKLMGAQNVLVAGASYDVAFLDGTCVAIFTGCNESSDFAFHTSFRADDAAHALLDQVFLDGPSGDFDTHPELTNGCNDLTQCLAYVPHSRSIFVDARYAFNYVAVGGVVDPDSVLPLRDFSGEPTRVWARFTPAATSVPVPEPTSLLLLTTGVAAQLAKARRGKQRNAQNV